MKNIVKIFILLNLLAAAIFAQQDLGGGWKLNGQIQLRTELDGRDFSNSTHPLTLANMRTRLGVEKSFNEMVQLFVQFQDSRVLGEEPNTLAAIDNIDLHQGFIKLNKIFGWDFSLQAGRFEVAYGTEKFFGAVGWHYVGRSFDGVRINIASSSFPFDMFALTISEPNSYIGNPNPFTYPYPQEPTPSHSVYGFYKNLKITDKSRIDILGYYENNRYKTNQGDDMLKMFTAAGTYFGNYSNFSAIAEAAYQFGKMGELDISSYLLSLSGKYKVSTITLGAGFDLLSGTESGSDNFNTFHATYGTNHKFYGYMDYFINIPANTLFAGLNDFYFKADFQPEGSDFSFAADLHHFMSNKEYPVIPPNDPQPNNESIFGQEIDLTVRYNFIKRTAITWGGSVFIPAALMKAFFTPREDVAYWSYLMITANL